MRTRLSPFIVVCLLLAVVPTSAAADAAAYPDLDGRISMVRGQPILLPTLESNREIDEVRVAIDGRAVQTDDFPPFEELILTRRFDHLGFELEVEHTITQTAFSFDEAEGASASYPLFIHPLPLIPRVHVFPLVVKKRTHLVGFQLRGILPGAHVLAWVHGFSRRPGLFAVPLRMRKSRGSSRTYVVPGGLDWRKGSRPHLVFSIGPPPGAFKFHFLLRGRVFTGFLRTKHNGDTVIRQTDGWKRCAYELSRDGRPPRKASCVDLF